jgi:hypothetical protein
VFGIFLTPVFYYAIMWRSERLRLRASAAAAKAATVPLKGHHGTTPASAGAVDKTV